jgi:hypothetical protein
MSKLSKSSAELTLSTSVAELAEVLANWSRTMANLDDAQPGFPSSTPGASPSTGPGPASADRRHDGVSDVVGRMATQPDEARIAQGRLLALVASIGVSAHEVYSLSRTWGFDRHQGKLDIDDAVTAGWCECHQRVGLMEPIDRDRYARVCRWCGDFKATEGRFPSADLLLARHEGRRITRAMIEADHPARKVRSGRKGSRRSAA